MEMTKTAAISFDDANSNSTQTIKTKYFIDSGFEVEVDAAGNTRELHYISGGDGLCAIFVTQNGNISTGTMYFVHTDYLGSLNVITNAAGTKVDEYSFDAWGRRRNPTNWTYTGIATAFTFDRGYTGHEHLDQAGLINMNGRMYDPVLGRFLSPDNYVQSPDNTQNFNRYSYCLNNPLSYTDPSGELLNPFLWGAIIGGAGYTASTAFSNGGLSNWNFYDFAKSAGIGAFSGATTANIGEIFGPVGSNGIMGELSRAANHAFSQGLISTVSGDNFLSGFSSSGVSSIASSAFMMYGGALANNNLVNLALAGLGGGISSKASGGNFWRGSAIGIMNASLNHLQSVIDEYGNQLFPNKKAAYDYMWKNSFLENGKVKSEVSCWDIKDGGYIVLRSDKNGEAQCDNSSLPVYYKKNMGWVVKFNGKEYFLGSYSHTHPSKILAAKNPPIGLGASDIQFHKWFKYPMHILHYNNTIWEFNGKSTVGNEWIVKKIGIW